jgi:chromosome segregation ATPase
MTGRLIIEQIGRTTTDGKFESIEFKEGVNAIVGEQNTGKSTWLRMLDFLMGENESAKENFDEVIIQKYRAISSLLRFGTETVEIERQWSDDGSRSQIRLNGDRINADQVQDLFLEQLNIPKLRYPQGNVLGSERTWPSLGWRSLLRHIYRRQDQWSDLVPKQPESEEHACVLQFLGLAEHVFSSDLSTLTDKRKRLAHLETRQEYFRELMQKLLPDLMGDPDLSRGVTAGAVENAVERIEAELGRLAQRRNVLMTEVRDQAHNPKGELGRILDERSLTLHRKERTGGELAAIADRVKELDEYNTGPKREAQRLDRADAAADVLEDIKLTHCPACDQSVEERTHESAHCFLCGQTTLSAELRGDAATRRLRFEREQIGAELVEAEELLASARQEMTRKEEAITVVDRRLRDLDTLLRPFQAAASGLLPVEVALLDQRIGMLQTRRDTIEALRGPLEESADLAIEISELQSEIRKLEAKVSERQQTADFEKAGDRLSDGLNAYLSTIREQDERSWTKSGEASASISENRTLLKIGSRSAKKQLGGTLMIYFLFAYNYALLNLSRYPDCHYPGLTMLDFYPDIAQESALGDRLHLVLGPFVQLSLDGEIAPIQVIATTRALPERPNINFIRLTEVWK